MRGGMTKAELVDQVARTTQLTKKHAEIMVNTVFDSIVDSLKDGEKIELRGFGSFRIRQRGSRTGRNPKTGARVDVPSKSIPYFKPGKELRELLNGEDGESGSRL
jgi:integration host factor subunit beta